MGKRDRRRVFSVNDGAAEANQKKNLENFPKNSAENVTLK